MIGTARDAPIPNLHSDPVGPASDSEISGPAPGFRSLRAAPAPDAHGFRHAFGKTAITFRPGIGIAYVTTIRNRHSETVDKALVSQNSVPGPKFPPGACVLVHRLSYPSVGRGYLFARGSEPPARPQFRIGTSTRSVNGRIRRFPVRRPNSSPGVRSRAADAIAYGHPFAQKGITFRSVLGIAYKTPIRNRHSEAPVATYHLRR